MSAQSDKKHVISSHWQTKPLKAIASYVVSSVDKIPSADEIPVRLCNYTDVYKNEFITPEMEFMQATATSQEIERFRLSKDDVIITKDSESWEDIAVPALVVEAADDLVCGYHLAILRPVQDRMLGRFLFRCFQSRAIRLHLELAATGVTRFGLPKDEIGKLQVPVPSLQEQKYIADYLDAETARIDALIAEKEEMLNLLAEKRAALVSKVVTQGLDSNVSMKPSGRDWLGVIPLHWQIKRFKHFARIGNGSTPNREKLYYWEGGDFPWLNSSVVNSRIVSEASRYVTTDAITECHLPKISPPALLVAITGQGKTRGKSAVLNFEATINQHLAFIQPFPQTADCLYLSFLLDSAYLFIRSNSDGSGSTRGAITCEQLSNFYVPLPPYKEQLEILKYIDEQISEFELIQENLLKSVSLLKERRSALITAAVTGRLCVK